MTPAKHLVPIRRLRKGEQFEPFYRLFVDDEGGEYVVDFAAVPDTGWLHNNLRLALEQVRFWVDDREQKEEE